MESNEKSNKSKELATSPNKFAVDVTWAFSSISITLVIAVVFKIVIGNYFGPTGLGLYALVLVLTSVVAVIGDFGIPASMVKFISQYQHDKKKLDKIISCGLTNALLFGSILGVIFFVFAEYIAQIFDEPALAPLLRLVSIMFPFLIVNDVFTGIFNGFRWMKKYTYSTIIRRVGLLVICWFLILLGLGVVSAILALVIKEVIVFFYNLKAMGNIKINIQLKGHFRESKELMHFSKYLFLSYQVGYLNTNLDTFLIGYFLAAKDVGIYAVAVMIARFFLTIPEAISRVVLPMASELFEKKAHAKIERAINLIVRYSFIVITILGLITIFFGSLIIRTIYPGHPEFSLAYIPLTLLLFGIIIQSLAYPLSGLFTAAGKPNVVLYTAGFTSLINISMDIVLIPMFGINGAALATAFIYIISASAQYILFRRILKLKLISRWFLIGFPSFTFIIIIYFILQVFFNPYLLVILLFPIYIVILYAGKIITEDDHQYFRSIILKIRRKK